MGAGSGGICSIASAVKHFISKPVSVEQILGNSWSAIANSFIAANDQLYQHLLTQKQTLEAEIVEAITALPEYAALVEALALAKNKGYQSDKVPQYDTNNHHIIAEHSVLASPARGIWKDLCHFDINADENLVTVSTQMHWFMHTSTYYTCVNVVVTTAYYLPSGTPTENVKYAVKLLKELIQATDTLIP